MMATTADPENEPTRVITVRLPKSMHEYLRTEAHDLRTSMNKLCISKLLQVIEEDMIPNEGTAAAARGNSTPKSSTPTPPEPAAATSLSHPVSQPLGQPTYKPTQPRF